MSPQKIHKDLLPCQQHHPHYRLHYLLATRVILEDGTEQPFPRQGPARLVEQIRVFRIAAAHRADALVLECMALQPHLQHLSQRRIVQAHIAVITNVRPDHLDVMGPDMDDVALALAAVAPPNGILITRQSYYDAFFRHICAEENCELRLVSDDDVRRIPDALLARFCYLEHAENVAMALAVCQAAGVPREIAMEGMVCARPDPGALRVYRGQTDQGRWNFAAAFAANDPLSSMMLWDLLMQRYPDHTRRILVVNCRADRLDRSKQLGQMMAQHIQADLYVLVGMETHTAMRQAQLSGLAPERIVDMEKATAPQVYEYLMKSIKGNTLLVGIGNIRGLGVELSERFQKAGSAT
ncbi:MAG: poly-gamma-glutamate synthase PgsB [Planctomycetota bacterium]|nr:poly-gamma-glutamate synthase PgsB [Planctomycetota bacterium]